MCISCAQSGLAAAESIGLEQQSTKIVSIAAAAVMLFSLAAPMTAPANSVKAGAVCAKTNQKIVKSGKTFVCKKSGKSLRWQVQKKNSSSKSGSSNSSNQSNDPNKAKERVLTNFFAANKWSTDFTRQQLIDSAMYEFIKFAEKPKLKSPGVKAFFQDTIPESERDWIVSLNKKSLEIFADFHPNQYVFLMGTTDDWAKQKGNELGLTLNTPQYPCGSPTGEYGGGCAGLNWGIYFAQGVLKNRTQQGSIVWDSNSISTSPHEFFHSVQTQSDPMRGRIPPESPRFTPRWFIEGSANFVGAIISHVNKNHTYEEFRLIHVDQNSSYVGTLGRRPLRDFWNNASGPDGYLNPYGIGQAATEYLVANVGVEPLIHILEQAHLLGSFGAGFEKAVGISLTEFYSKFDSVRPKIGLPAIN
jgi:hypothetical protein